MGEIRCRKDQVGDISRQLMEEGIKFSVEYEGQGLWLFNLTGF